MPVSSEYSVYTHDRSVNILEPVSFGIGKMGTFVTVLNADIVPKIQLPIWNYQTHGSTWLKYTPKLKKDFIN
jgi:hypothetical protein